MESLRYHCQQSHNYRPHRRRTHFSFFTSQLQAASKQLLPLKQRSQCKPWIQEDTLRAPEAARQAEAQTLPNSKTLRNQAKRKARKDRVKSQMVHNWLKEDPSRRFGTQLNPSARVCRGSVRNSSSTVNQSRGPKLRTQLKPAWSSPNGQRQTYQTTPLKSARLDRQHIPCRRTKPDPQAATYCRPSLNQKVQSSGPGRFG